MTIFDKYLQNIKNKNIAVIGIGVSNTPLIELLAQNGANVTAFDKKTAKDLGETYESLKSIGIKFVLGESYLDSVDGFDIIFRSPGVHPDKPALVRAVQNGAELTSEMEVFFNFCPCKIIAITGSDGKTTTTTLVYEILKTAGFTCHLGGNIGRPLLCDIPNINESDIAIVELSSFQLMTMKQSPYISAITNITPNHLDMHTDMDEYVKAKTNIFEYQAQSDICILNADDEICSDFSPNSTLFQFSMNTKVQNGAYLKGDDIVLVQNGAETVVMKTSDIKIVGRHNIANFLTALCITSPLCDNKNVKTVAQNFGGVAHRIELVRTLDGVSYYNDSIASSPTRTIAGLRSFDKKIILIAGGYDKNLDYAPLAPEIINRVKHLILLGDTAPKIEIAVKEHAEFNSQNLIIDNFKSFENAINHAKNIAQNGDIVVLSPASASFDLFRNFAHRGDTFRNIVNGF